MKYLRLLMNSRNKTVIFLLEKDKIEDAMEQVLKKYQGIISKAHEELAKELAATQKKPFTLPLTTVQIMILQEFVDVVFPDLISEIKQIDDEDPPYFSLTTSPRLIVDYEWWEKAFSHFFVRPVYLHGSLLGFANTRVYFFKMAAEQDRVFDLRNGKKVFNLD